MGGELCVKKQRMESGNIPLPQRHRDGIKVIEAEGTPSGWSHQNIWTEKPLRSVGNGERVAVEFVCIGVLPPLSGFRCQVANNQTPL